MKSVEAGTNWAIKRDFIPPQLAKAAAREALFLSALTRCTTVSFAYREKRDNGPSVVTLKSPKLARCSLLPLFSALQEVYEHAEEEVETGGNKFHLNSYGSGELRHPHTDIGQDTSAILAVGLIGQAEAKIHDPGTGQMHLIELAPTDAIYFGNELPEAGRPAHTIRSTLVRPRRELMIGAPQ